MKEWSMSFLILVLLGCRASKNTVETLEITSTPDSKRSTNPNLVYEKNPVCDSLFENSSNFEIIRMTPDSFLFKNKDIYEIEAYDNNYNINKINIFGGIGIDTIYSCLLPIEEIIRIEKNLCNDIITEYPKDHIYFKHNKEYLRQYIMISFEGFEYLVVLHTLDLRSDFNLKYLFSNTYINQADIMANDSLFRSRFIYNITNDIINSYYLDD
jgi:hypothetical protein